MSMHGSIPAEEYIQAQMLCEEIGQYLLRMQALIRKGPAKFGGNVDPAVRLATGVLRSDKISELGKTRDHMRAAVEAAEHLDGVHQRDTEWRSQQLVSKPIRPHIYDEWPPIERKGPHR